MLSSGNTEEALHQLLFFIFFSLTFCTASNALRVALSHVLHKMIENLTGCIEWVEVSVCETAVREVLVFPQIFRGFPSPLSLL